MSFYPSILIVGQIAVCSSAQMAILGQLPLNRASIVVYFYSVAAAYNSQLRPH